MFTGIVEELGTVRCIGSGHIKVAACQVLDALQVGDSIAVNGICLTVTAFDDKGFQADVMPETIRRTSLSQLRQGSVVNLERALTLSSRLGGHIVSGHIDGVGEIISFTEEKNALLMKIAAPAAILRYIVEKGSVALDGISLTVAGVTAEGFSVSLIPHTRKVTDLRDKKPGDSINIENDVVGKYIERLLQPPVPGDGTSLPTTGSISRGFLAKYGF